MVNPSTPFDSLRIDLTAPDLFGNEAAEDEDEDVFRSYALDRMEVSAFVDTAHALCVARAYKGEGKSALLRLADSGLRDRDSDTIIIHRTALQIAPEGVEPNFPSWVRAWKEAIFGLLAREIGARIGVAWSDDAISLVEEAERSGAKSRSLLASIIDRLPFGEVSLGEVKLPLAINRKGAVNPEEVVRRWAASRPPLYLLIDDVDKNFERSQEQKFRVTAFFDACREALRAMPELRMRVAVRPNVWTVLKLEFESLSHVEQYVHDLTWSEEQARTLLARRIEGYLSRTGQLAGIENVLPKKTHLREKKLIELVFGLPIPWGRTTRPPHVILYTLSKHRPRWMIELSRSAASRAVRAGRKTINIEDITRELDAFGRRRIQDMAAEFRSQCPEISELITAFNREPEEFSTDELLSLIARKILSHMDVRISGVSGKPSKTDVAAFLFEIGFFYARRDNKDGSYQHFTFSERPMLLRSRSDLDAGVRWEVHPVFRQVLEMRDPMGRER